MSINPQRITELTLKAAAGSLTPGEQAELDLFLDAHPDNRLRFEERISRQKVKEGLQGLEDGERSLETSWSRISRSQGNIQASGGSRIVLLRRSMGVAAAVLLVVAGVWLIGKNSHHKVEQSSRELVALPNDVTPGGYKATLTLSNGRQIVLNELSTGSTLAEKGDTKIVKRDSAQLSYTAVKGKSTGDGLLSFNTLTTPMTGIFTVVLPDGTKVWMNAASSLRYPTSFEGQTSREVALTGEAYFEVAKNVHQPFIVRSGQATVNVLGTSFDCMAYPDEPAMRTTLLEGSVSITHKDSRSLLQPGQQATITDGSAVKITKVDVDVAVAWKNGFFNFDHADLRAVMRQLGRWYGIEVVYNGDVPDRSFFGVIDRQLTLAQTLKILASNNIHYSIEGKRLLINP